MTMIEQLGTGYVGRMMIGQAMVYRVASELLLRGHVPYFPSVDSGVDILVDNGLRLQVKARTLYMGHPQYTSGAYPFSTKENSRKGKWANRKRDWSKVCDFIIYVGIDEMRYFVVPATRHNESFWIRPKESTKYCVSVEAMKTLRDKGMTYKSIAEELGVNDMTVIRNLRKPSKLNSSGGNRHLASFEDRWDLLDLNGALNNIESAVAETSKSLG